MTEPKLTPRKVYRIVRGAVEDVKHSHPRWQIDAAMSASISKRVAGTLRGLGVGLIRDSDIVTDQKSDRVVSKRRYRKGARFGSQQILHFLGVEAGSARRHGNTEREKAMVDVLKFVGSNKRRRYKGT